MRPMSRTRTHLEEFPFPRAESRGPTSDEQGVPLHGSYGSVDGRLALREIFNNGSVITAYRHPDVELIGALPRHRDSNLSLRGSNDWRVPNDSPRPITAYPRSEYPGALCVDLDDSWAILMQVLAGLKPFGSLCGATALVDGWEREARAAKLCVIRHGHHFDGWDSLLISPKRMLVRSSELKAATLRWTALETNAHMLAEVMQGLEASALVTIDDLVDSNWMSPPDDASLVRTGMFCGYRPESTWAILHGEQLELVY
jgi:hypothetical protein